MLKMTKLCTNYVNPLHIIGTLSTPHCFQPLVITCSNIAGPILDLTAQFTRLLRDLECTFSAFLVSHLQLSSTHHNGVLCGRLVVPQGSPCGVFSARTSGETCNQQRLQAVTRHTAATHVTSAIFKEYRFSLFLEIFLHCIMMLFLWLKFFCVALNVHNLEDS